MDFTKKQLEKIKNFKWEDEEEGTADQPGIALAENVLECAECIFNYVAKSLSLASFENCKVFSVPVPSSVHKMLEERYNCQWNIDSRSKIFELIRGAFILYAQTNRSKMQDAVSLLFPDEARPEHREKLLKEAMTEWPELSPDKIGVTSKSLEIRSFNLYDEPPITISVVERHNNSERVDEHQAEIVAEIEVQVCQKSSRLSMSGQTRNCSKE